MPSATLLRYVHTWHQTKSIVHLSKLLVFFATVTAMTEPTLPRILVYSATTAAYILVHMLMSMIVVNVVCAGEILDRHHHHHHHHNQQQQQKQKQQASAAILPSRWIEYLQCVSQNLIGTCVAPSGSGMSSMENIKSMIAMEEKGFTAAAAASASVREHAEVLKRHKERHALQLTLITEVVRALLCCVYIAWSQYYLGPLAPTWLWGIVRSGMRIVETETKNVKFAIMFSVQFVTLITLWTVGASWSTITTSFMCLLPSYVLGERLFEYVHERAETTQTMREYERVASFKTKLLSQISHELRSPLMSIIAVTEMAMNADCSDEIKMENCSIILSCSTELLAMINDILDFGKLEGKKALLDIKPIDLRVMMEEIQVVMKTALRTASNKGLGFDLRFRENVPSTIESDEVKLHQICRNLIGNAIKFTDEGMVTVELDVLPPSAILRKYIQDRQEYEICFLPTTTRGSVIHKLELLQTLGISDDEQKQSEARKFTQLSLRKAMSADSSGIFLPETTDSSREALLSVEKTLCSECELLVLSVSDTGIGINDNDFTRLFVPFAQADGSFTRKYGGTGLGLSITREVVDLMGGFIIVFSTPGRGSKFTVALPVERSQMAIPDLCNSNSDSNSNSNSNRSVNNKPTAVDNNRSVSADTDDTSSPVSMSTVAGAYSRASSKVGNDGGGANPQSIVTCNQIERAKFGHVRCLVVDDQVLNRKVFRRLLINLGFTEALIECAEDGQEACDLFVQRCQEGRGFNLCLLDMMMPRMDGFTALRTLRQHEGDLGSNNRCIVIMVSANVIEIEKSKSHGADSFLAKPFTTAMLQEKLNDLMNNDNGGILKLEEVTEA